MFGIFNVLFSTSLNVLNVFCLTIESVVLVPFQVLHEAFAPEGLILTTAVSAGKFTIDSAYDVPAISQ